jgi:hypothetical protein
MQAAMPSQVPAYSIVVMHFTPDVAMMERSRAASQTAPMTGE